MAKVIIEADTSLPKDLESLRRFFGAASAELTKVVGAVSIKAKAANPEELKEVLGHDPHTETAAKVFNKPGSEVTEEERQEGKKVNLAAQYGSKERFSELDTAGLFWDKRIHASTKKLNKDGSYKRRKNVSDEYFNEIADEIRKIAGTDTDTEPTDETLKEGAPTKDEPKKEQAKTDTEDAPNLQKMDLPGVLSFIDLQVEKDPESKSIHTNLLTALKKLMAINSKLRDPAMKYINTFKKENGNLCVSPRDLQPCDIPKVTEWIRTKGTQDDE